MRNIWISLLWVVVTANATFSQQYDHIAKTNALPPKEALKTFRLPADFEIQLVASEPVIGKPMNMAFDGRGRLWITTSQEYPFAAKEGEGRDRIYILEDFAPDGAARKVQVFADRLNIPIGLCPMPDGRSVIVFSIAKILKLTDTNEDGKADQTEVLYSGFGTRDTHGMVNSFNLMPDGWIYACHGFNNDSIVKGKDGAEVKMNSGNTFRFRPDGSRIEAFTFGQVNPFGMCFDEQYQLYNADCHSKPISQLIPQGYYSSFGKPHDGLGFVPDMIRHSHDSTALCGLVFYQASHFPKELQGTMFLGNVTGNRINHDRLLKTGATPQAQALPDFLTSSDPWFRPVDIKLGLDGALYIADFYNKIIGHYEVPLNHPDRDRTHGRIWRIVYKPNLQSLQNNSIATLSDEQLLEKLTDTNLVVRALATLEAQRRGTTIREKLFATYQHSKSEIGKVHAAWALETVQPLTSEALLQLATKGSTLEQLHAYKILKSRNLTASHIQMLLQHGSKHPEVQRLQAEVLALYPTLESLQKITGLLQAGQSDSYLQHALRISLRQLCRDPKIWQTEAAWSATDRLWVHGIIPGLREEIVAQYLAQQLQRQQTIQSQPGGDSTAGMLEFIARYGSSVQQQQVLETIRKVASNSNVGLNWFKAFYRGLLTSGKPRETANPLGCDIVEMAIASKQPANIAAIAEVAGMLQQPVLFSRLNELLADRKMDSALRSLILQALVQSDRDKSVAVCSSIIATSSESGSLREKAIEQLGQLRNDLSRQVLLDSLKMVSNRFSVAIAVALCGYPAGAEALLHAIEQGKASPTLLTEKVVQTKLAEAKIANWSQRVARLTKDIPSTDERLKLLLQTRSAGYAQAMRDAVKGKLVYMQNCAACHQLNGEGAKIGPQLDGIGLRGVDRILEDTLDPNRNVDAAFRQTVIQLNDGRTISGLVLREEGKTIILADQQGKEVRITMDQIEEKRQSILSPMPANWAETIPEKDYYDLLAYLLQQKPKPMGK